MTLHDEHVYRQDGEQPPTALGEESPPRARLELVLQAAETVRQIVEGEPR